MSYCGGLQYYCKLGATSQAMHICYVSRTYLQRDIRSTGALGTIWIVFPVTKASWKDLSDKFEKGKTLLLFLCQTKRRKRISLVSICEV
uniref:Uncharacterized protein n=1 Tax=Junco hyemalis TaxID=40217 RepID=A0A8C5JBH7_JUNHY